MMRSIGMQSMLALNIPTEISLVLLIMLRVELSPYYWKDIFSVNC